jgi:hypothetical protein
MDAEAFKQYLGYFLSGQKENTCGESAKKK